MLTSTIVKLIINKGPEGNGRVGFLIIRGLLLVSTRNRNYLLLSITANESERYNAMSDGTRRMAFQVLPQAKCYHYYTFPFPVHRCVILPSINFITVTQIY